jgi:hypothetical protein
LPPTTSQISIGAIVPRLGEYFDRARVVQLAASDHHSILTNGAQAARLAVEVRALAREALE